MNKFCFEMYLLTFQNKTKFCEGNCVYLRLLNKYCGISNKIVPTVADFDRKSI